ncbi:MAG: hypothetical protein PHW96_04240, partial [Candidatus Nanoarchaeia archaeon]|nr:hypothetical protein [Candidatus Nanoarchaeia archaeon]
MKNEKMSAEERLKSYLECESILNEFFSKVDYCTRFCSLIVLNSLEDDEKTGCCSYGCYDLFKRVSLKDASLLRTERNDKYGVPDRKDL